MQGKRSLSGSNYVVNSAMKIEQILQQADSGLLSGTFVLLAEKLQNDMIRKTSDYLLLWIS